MDPRPQRQADARHRTLHAERRFVEAVVAGSRKPNDDTLTGELVGAHALELAHVLDPRRRGGRREAEARHEQGKKGGEDGALGHGIGPWSDQKGLMIEKKRESQPWRLARAMRSEKRGVGEECVGTCKSRWGRDA